MQINIKDNLITRLLKHKVITIEECHILLNYDVISSRLKILLVDNLYNKQLITEEETILLLKDVDVIEYIVPVGDNTNDIFKPYQPMIGNNNFYESCSCNPKNGGNGVCGCTLGKNIIN